MGRFPLQNRSVRSPPFAVSQSLEARLLMFRACQLQSLPVLLDRKPVGFLYGAGAETLLLVTMALGEICPREEKPKTVVYSQKTNNTTGLGIRY